MNKLIKTENILSYLKNTVQIFLLILIGILSAY